MDSFYSVNLALSQAIEDDQLHILQTAVAAMKRSAGPSEHVLDVCEMVPEPVADPHHEYPMTLLAFAGYHARFDMLNLLIKEGARKSTIIQYTIDKWPPEQHTHFVVSKNVATPSLTQTDLHALLLHY